MSKELDITDTLKAKSDQLNAVDLVRDVTVTITRVEKKRSDQPVVIHLQGYEGRPFKPCLSMRRILGNVWGTDASVYEGRSMTLFCDNTVTWAGQAVGGIRISHLSHMSQDSVEVPIAINKRQREMYKVDRLDLSADSAKMINEAKSNEELDAVVSTLRGTMPQDKFAALKETVTDKRSTFNKG